MCRPVKLSRVLPNLPDVLDDLTDIVVLALRFVPILQLALVFGRTSRITHNELLLNRSEVHGGCDDLGVMRNTK